MIPLQSFASAGLSGRLHWFQHPWAMGMTAAKPKALTRADLENIIVVVIDCECVSVLQNFRAREKRVRTGNIQNWCAGSRLAFANEQGVLWTILVTASKSVFGRWLVSCSQKWPAPFLNELAVR